MGLVAILGTPIRDCLRFTLSQDDLKHPISITSVPLTLDLQIVAAELESDLGYDAVSKNDNI
jgi:hypothetical protein